VVYSLLESVRTFFQNLWDTLLFRDQMGVLFSLALWCLIICILAVLLVVGVIAGIVWYFW
jgi:hypothetical protein